MDYGKRGVSSSMIGAFDDCPYKVKLSKIDGVAPIMWSSDIYFVGSGVHDAIQHYYAYDYLINGCAEDILYYVYGALTRKWSQPENMFFKTPDLQKAHQCLVNFAQWEANRKEEVKPMIELKIGEAGYFGYIDLYDAVKGFSMDWKTQKYPGLGRGYKIQAIIYKKMLDSRYKINLPKFYFNFLYPNVVMKVDFLDKKIQELMLEVEEKKNQILEAFKTNTFPKNPRTPKMCNNCELKYYCKVLKK